MIRGGVILPGVSVLAPRAFASAWRLNFSNTRARARPPIALADAGSLINGSSAVTSVSGVALPPAAHCD